MVDVIERACSLQSLLADETIRRAVGGLGSLPSRPKIYQQLTHLLADPDSSVKDVACVVEQDVAMCAKILQLVNSSFFSMPRRLATIEAAVGFLGTNMLKQLTLSVEAFRAWEKAISIPGFSLESLMEHGLMVANIASRLLTVKRDIEDAFMAGMLHDIGRLILAAGFPEKLETAIEISRAEGRPLEVVEREVIGVSHSHIGAYLLGLWGVSYAIVEAVAHHDEPGEVGESMRFDVLAAVRIADQLVHECEPENAVDGIATRLDSGYLEALGVADRLPEWRRMAQEMVESHTG
jgi:putative nucleotidyltransferase with HDIG domain